MTAPQDRIPVSGTGTSPVYRYYVDTSKTGDSTFIIVPSLADLVKITPTTGRIVVVLNDDTRTNAVLGRPICYVANNQPSIYDLGLDPRVPPGWSICAFVPPAAAVPPPVVSPYNRVLRIGKLQASSTGDINPGFYKNVVSVKDATIVFDGKATMYAMTVNGNVSIQYVHAAVIPTDMTSSFIVSLSINTTVATAQFPPGWVNVGVQFTALTTGIYLIKVDIIDGTTYYRLITDSAAGPDYAVWANEHGDILTDENKPLS